VYWLVLATWYIRLKNRLFLRTDVPGSQYTAQTGPFSIRLQHLPTAFWLFCRFQHHYSLRSTVLAVILRIARFIPTILDDAFTATRAAFVRHGYLHHAADYGSSLTFSHHRPV
jgi:hypothetical protein